MSDKKFTFYSNYGKRPKNVMSYNSGELKVEASGYRPAYKEIASMIVSGQTFENVRESFQYQDEASIDSDVNHVDTYDKDDFEMMDVAREASRVLGASIEAAKASKRKAEIEAIKSELKAEMAAEQAATQPASGERAS